MSELAVVVRHFPMHELTIRRLHARAAEFRTLCEDYTTARYALDRWRNDEVKSKDFEQLSDELGAEIEEAVLRELKAVHQNHAD